MKQILTKNEPLRLATKRDMLAGNYGAQLKRPDRGYKAPEGFSYVDDLPMPNPVDGYRWVRKLTDTEYGWEQVAVPVIVPTPVSMAQFQEEITKDAYKIGGVSLFDIVEGAVAQAGTVMGIWWRAASVVDRQNPKVLLMASSIGVSSETLDAIFIGAALN